MQISHLPHLLPVLPVISVAWIGASPFPPADSTPILDAETLVVPLRLIWYAHAMRVDLTP